MTTFTPDPTGSGEQYPTAVVESSSELHGLRYVTIGDDGQYIVILGHPTREQVGTFAPVLAEKLWQDATFAADYDDLDFTWARVLWTCPDHGGVRTGGCQWCSWMEPGVWGLDWSVPQGFPSDVNRTKPGYFPVAIWEDC
ncbi:hypothetical protein [Saccharothrix stipae]